jgi:hypothetical protein
MDPEPTTTQICEVCFGYGWTETPVKCGYRRWKVRHPKGGWICTGCDGLGNIGAPVTRSLKTTPSAVANRAKSALRRARKKASLDGEDPT